MCAFAVVTEIRIGKVISPMILQISHTSTWLTLYHAAKTPIDVAMVVLPGRPLCSGMSSQGQEPRLHQQARGGVVSGSIPLACNSTVHTWGAETTKHTYEGRVCACAQNTGAAACESLRQDRPRHVHVACVPSLRRRQSYFVHAAATLAIHNS